MSMFEKRLRTRISERTGPLKRFAGFELSNDSRRQHMFAIAWQ
jgi:hypothetical protein